jgi:hypothetical protein
MFRKNFDWEKWKREHRWDDLATYNAEVARGIMHTPEWKTKMAEEQELFNAEQNKDTTCADTDCRHPMSDHPTMRGVIADGITTAVVPFCVKCQRNCTGVFFTT